MMPTALALALRHRAEIALVAAVLLAVLNLDTGIVLGIVLALALLLHYAMRPRVAILGLAPDGALRAVRGNNLSASAVMTAVRFDGYLYFGNATYFEDAVLEAVANNPEAPYVLVVGDGINDIDASGEEVIHHLVEHLNESGVVVLFAGLKKQVIDVMQATGLWKVVGEHRFFPTADHALERIHSHAKCAGEDDLPRFNPDFPLAPFESVE